MNNKSVVTLGEHRGAVTKIAVYPNGNLLASSGRDGHVKLWDTRRKRSLADVIANDGTAISGVCFDQYGGWMLSVGHDNIVKTFDIRMFTNRADDVELYSGTIDYNKTTADVAIDDEGVVALAIDDKFKFFDTNNGWSFREEQNSAMKVSSVCSLCA